MRRLELPLTRQVDASDGGDALRAAAAEVADRQWVVLTSVNAVERFMAVLRDARAFGRCRSPRSARPPPTHCGWRAWSRISCRPSTARRGLVEEFPEPEGARARRVLFPCAEGAPGTIVEGLGHKGWEVRRVEAYRTVP